MGYTPLFSSLTTGTLCGRWPDIGLWPIVLSLADRHGVVDVTPAYISGVTGLPLLEVSACMQRFCEPDAYSRSDAENGARLVLLDSHRDWGWRIVNHGLYREKARKAAFDAKRVADGSNAGRMKERAKGPATTRDDPRSSDGIGADPPSYSNTNTNKEREVRAKRSRRAPKEFSPDLDLARSQLPNVDAHLEAQKFSDWEFNTPRSDWAAVWRNWVQRCKETGKYAKQGNGGWQ